MDKEIKWKNKAILLDGILQSATYLSTECILCLQGFQCLGDKMKLCFVCITTHLSVQTENLSRSYITTKDATQYEYIPLRYESKYEEIKSHKYNFKNNNGY